MMVMEGYLFPGSLRSLNLHYETKVQWMRFLTLRHDFATSKKHLSSHVSTIENYMRLSRGKAVSSHFRMKASLTLGSARLFDQGSDSGTDQTIPRTKWRLLAAFLQVARSAGLPKCNLLIVTIGSLEVPRIALQGAERVHFVKPIAELHALRGPVGLSTIKRKIFEN